MNQEARSRVQRSSLFMPAHYGMSTNTKFGYEGRLDPQYRTALTCGIDELNFSRRSSSALDCKENCLRSVNLMSCFSQQSNGLMTSTHIVETGPKGNSIRTRFPAKSLLKALPACGNMGKN